MIGIKASRRKAGKEEAEKPFWISFSDLMSALMVLFLVAMTVALLAITHDVSETERQKAERDDEIRQVLERIRQATKDYPGINVRVRSVDFGDRARDCTHQTGRACRGFGRGADRESVRSALSNRGCERGNRGTERSPTRNGARVRFERRGGGR